MVLLICHVPRSSVLPSINSVRMLPVPHETCLKCARSMFQHARSATGVKERGFELTSFPPTNQATIAASVTLPSNGVIPPPTAVEWVRFKVKHRPKGQHDADQRPGQQPQTPSQKCDALRCCGVGMRCFRSSPHP